jgi:hypothetical protein
VKNKIHSSTSIAFPSCNCFSFLSLYARRSLVRTAVLGLCILASAFISPARAATIAWTNTSGGSWSVAANWSPNSVPVASSDVFVTNNGTYTVTMDVSPTISSLTLGGISGQQTLTNTSKTLTLSLASVVNTNGVLGMSAGVLSGSGSLSINGQVHWNGGSSGNGFSVTVQSNAVLNIGAGISLSGALTNLGVVNWLAANFSINTGSGMTGTIWNQAGAVFDIQCDQVAANGVLLAIFHNAGLVRKRIATGTTTFNAAFDNSGTVQAQTGTINFAGGSNLGGTFQANSGAAINFTGGTYTLSSAPDFQGPGLVRMTDGNLTLNAFTGTFALNGITLIGQNTVAATGTINLSGSPLDNSATLTIASNAVLNILSGTTFSGAVTNLGTVNWLANNFSINTNGPATGTIWNQAGAVFNIQCDAVVANGALLATFHNAGLVRKRITAGLTTFNTTFDNSGIVQAQTGTINFAGGSNLGGTFQANSGAAINFTGGTYTLSSAPDFQGPGLVRMTDGNLTLNAFTGTFALNGITLIGQNTVAATGTINLSGSPLDNSATLTIASNAVLNILSGTTFSGAVTNLGTVNWLANNFSINTNGPATGTIWNQAGAVFDIQCDQVVVNGILLANFHNAGLVRKRITTGITTFNTVFDNSGSVQAQTGTINFAGGATLGGSFQANSGAAINFTGGTYTLSSPPNFQGPGTVQITTTTLNAFTGTFTLSGSTLVGQNTVAATGTINLNGTSLGNGASLTIASNAVLNLQTAITFSGVLTNQGTVNWLAGNVTVSTNGPTVTGAIWNQTGALFDIKCDQALNFNALLATFNNAGSLRKSAGSGTTTITVKLDNTGTIQAQTGVIGAQGSYTESPAATLAISLAALPPGTGFGKIQFSAKPIFAGKFTLSTLNSYRPNPGDSFFVLSYPSAAGDFTSLNGLDLGSGLRLAPHFSASGLTLVAASYPVNPVPSLTMDRSVSGALVAWPVNFTGWQLQSATNLPALSWTTVPVTGSNSIVLPFAVPQQYFRLFQ